MTLHELQQARTAKTAEMRGLLDAATAANRDLSDAEQTRFDALKGECAGLEKRIANAETVAEMERRASATPVAGGPTTRDLRGYSVARALRGAMEGRLDGLEGEMSQELSRGREMRGNIMIPVEMLLGERRAMQTGGSAGALVSTDHMAGLFIDRLRPAMKVEALGATVIGGCVGNLEIPRLTASAAAAWVAEDGAPGRSEPGFDKVTMAPKTVAAETQFSRRLMLQSSPQVEGIVRSDLAFMLSAALDKAAIKGGGANEPGGVLSLLPAGQIHALGANGGVPTPDDMADLDALLDIANVDAATAFLTNARVKRVANKAKDTVGQYYGLDRFFAGERYEFSNQVPADLTKGTGAGLSAILYGAWADLLIAYWSAVDVLVNPYHPDVASKGGVLIHAFLDADVAVRHVESFAAIIDAEA
jgi:HK97 family phage major capsid protein